VGVGGGVAVAWLKQLVVGFSPLRPEVKARAVDVGFMGDKMAVGQIFRQVLRFFAVCIVPPMFCTHSCIYEGWNFNSGNYLFTTDTK